MALKETYNKLPFDLAGSRTKNRFDFEILYGIEQLIDNYNVMNDYYIVFDYVCDIELHYDNKLKFFQVKTSDTGKTNNVSYLTKKKSDNSDSIISRMYKISGKTKEDKNNISVLLVSNVPLTNNKYTTKPNEVILLDSMDDAIKSKIIEHLKTENNNQEIDLQNIYYLYRNIGVQDFENSIIGKLSKFYENEKNVPINKPTVLLDSIKNLAMSKAKYEKECTFEELYSKKAISRDDFKEMIDYHYSQNSDLHKKCETQITNLTSDNILFQLKCIKSLKDIISRKDYKKVELLNIIYDKIKEDMNSELEIDLYKYAGTFKEKHPELQSSIYEDESTIFTMVIYCIEKLKEVEQ